MQALLDAWQAANDRRAIFLRCYAMMTANMLAALEAGEFGDATWVRRLLEHFAGYYFAGLEAFQKQPDLAPAAWQLAFRKAAEPRSNALQNLLLGVNAHINYDLALAVADQLGDEWAALDEAGRASRRLDFDHVNAIISRTVDSVQDEVLEPAMPVMELVDRLFGRLDEYLISTMLSQWRDGVWAHAVSLVEAGSPEERARRRIRVEADALRIGGIISGSEDDRAPA
jgi:hypothetical protein